MGVKISALPSIVAPALTDVFAVVQGGVTYKETFTQLSALIGTVAATTITGTANQVIASAPVGAVTLSLPQSIATTSDVTFGSVSFSPTTKGIVGTATNNNAASGYVGQIISSVIPSGSSVSFANATVKDLTSIALTAGDWDVYGNIIFIGSTTNITIAIVWINSTSATKPDPSLLNAIDALVGSQNLGQSAPYYRASLGAPATIYLSGQVNFASGTVNGSGGIYARRIR